LVRALDPGRKVALLSDGAEMPYDLFLGVPVHRAPVVVAEAGLTVDGWIPVDPRTLQTRYPGVYAVGDVTSVGTPKAGVFAEGQASVVAAQISAQKRGTAIPVAYDGRGICYMEL
jgi:sulfide:quinone oxidoreductase